MRPADLLAAAFPGLAGRKDWPVPGCGDVVPWRAFWRRAFSGMPTFRSWLRVLGEMGERRRRGEAIERWTAAGEALAQRCHLLAAAGPLSGIPREEAADVLFHVLSGDLEHEDVFDLALEEAIQRFMQMRSNPR